MVVKSSFTVDASQIRKGAPSEPRMERIREGIGIAPRAVGVDTRSYSPTISHHAAHSPDTSSGHVYSNPKGISSSSVLNSHDSH